MSIPLRRRLFTTLGFCLIHLTTASLGQERRQTVTGDVLKTLPIELPKVFDFKIPPRPAGHILDTANFLTPEVLKRLDDELSQEAKAHGVNIYVLIVPSVPKNGFDAFTEKMSEAWMGGLFGAMIVFDDGTGQVAIQPTNEVTKRFYDFELSMLLRDPMSTKNRPKHSREGLEHTALTLKTALHELKLRVDRDDRNSLLTKCGVTILCFLAVLWGAFEYYRRRTSREAEPSTNPRDLT
jgi:uncharacterized membrane protein YgcG